MWVSKFSKIDIYWLVNWTFLLYILRILKYVDNNTLVFSNRLGLDFLKKIVDIFIKHHIKQGVSFTFQKIKSLCSTY